MTAVRVTLVCILALSLQLTVFTDVRILGVAPEMLAMVAILAGYFGGPQRGQTVAFGAGLLWDIYLPTHLGVSALIFAVAAYAIGSIEAGLFHDSRSQRTALVTLATMVIVVVYALSNEIFGVRGLLNLQLLKVAAVAGLFNGALSLAAAPIMRWAIPPVVERPGGAADYAGTRG